MSETLTLRDMPDHLLLKVLTFLDIESLFESSQASSCLYLLALTTLAQLTGSSKDEALLLAASRGRADIIDQIIHHSGGYEPITDKHGNSPLLIATRKGHLRAVISLLRGGADPETRNDYGATSLHKCAEVSKLDIAAQLLRYGAIADCLDSKGRTPLLTASGQGDLNMCRLLLSYGADPNTRNSLNSTPLHAAAMGGHTEVVELLLLYNASISIKDAQQQTPVSVAHRFKRKPVIQLLQNSPPNR